MKILLINPKTEGYSRSVTLPLGLLSIASCLKKEGHGVRLYDRTVEKCSEKSVSTDFCPDVVGISLVSTKSVNDMLKLAAFFKKQGLPVIAGGPLASEMYAAVLKHRDIDIVSLGEGEKTWSELVKYFSGEKINLYDIKGIAYADKNTGEVIKTPEREFVDLGELPPIDYSLVNVPAYFQSSYGCDKMLYLYSAKGCPNNCTFCYNKDFHRCVYRKRPMEQVLNEIDELNKAYGMNGVYFADELWCRNKEEMHITCDALKSLGLDFVWGCQTRIGQFNEEDFKYMYNSGCRWIFFGVESGSPRILKLMNKHIPYDRIVPTFSDCKKAGITAIASFIAGFPDENEEDLKQTVSLIEKLDTSLVNLNYYALVPGSDMHKKLVAEGRYPQYTDVSEVADIKPVERIEYKFCSVPDTELKVIQSYYMWRSFTSKDASTGNGKSFAVKVITDAVKSLFSGNFINFFMSTFYSGISFIKIVFYSHAFPKVKKKYGIK